jgi:hypothetical protein
VPQERGFRRPIQLTGQRQLNPLSWGTEIPLKSFYGPRAKDVVLATFHHPYTGKKTILESITAGGVAQVEESGKYED